MGEEEKEGGNASRAQCLMVIGWEERGAL